MYFFKLGKLKAFKVQGNHYAEQETKKTNSSIWC
jgi:hypothetical protein